jgi:hypothetical protein
MVDLLHDALLSLKASYELVLFAPGEVEDKFWNDYPVATRLYSLLYPEDDWVWGMVADDDHVLRESKGDTWDYNVVLLSSELETLLQSHTGGDTEPWNPDSNGDEYAGGDQELVDCDVPGTSRRGREVAGLAPSFAIPSSPMLFSLNRGNTGAAYPRINTHAGNI